MSPGTDNCARTDELLLDYAYGELAGSPLRQVEEHLSSCAGCRAALDRVAGTRRAMAALTAEPAPSEGLESLLAYAEQAAARARSTSPPRWRWLVPAFSAGGLLAAALVVGVSHNRAPAVRVPASPLVMPAAAPALDSPADARQKERPEAPALGRAPSELSRRQSAPELPKANPTAERTDLRAIAGEPSYFGASAGKGASLERSALKEAAPARDEDRARAAAQADVGESRGAKSGQGRANAAPAVAPKLHAKAPASALSSGAASDGASESLSRALAASSPALPAPLEPAPDSVAPRRNAGASNEKEVAAKKISAGADVAAVVGGVEEPSALRAATEGGRLSESLGAERTSLLERARAQAKAGALQASLDTLARFLARFPDDSAAPAALLMRARLLEGMKRPAEASAARRELARRFPRSPEAHSLEERPLPAAQPSP